jgi:F0F1-type ATP synthase membrane subunit b/b'
MTNLFDDNNHSTEDVVKEIEALQKKREQALGLLSRYKTQLETLVHERDELVSKLEKEFDTTVAGAQVTLEALRDKRDALLAEAKKSLDTVDL